MNGVNCKQCNKRIASEYINIITGICVYCENKTDVFYYNGMTVTKKEAIENNKMFENLVKEEVKHYGRYRCH